MKINGTSHIPIFVDEGTQIHFLWWTSCLPRFGRVTWALLLCPWRVENGDCKMFGARTYVFIFIQSIILTLHFWIGNHWYIYIYDNIYIYICMIYIYIHNSWNVPMYNCLFGLRWNFNEAPWNRYGGRPNIEFPLARSPAERGGGWRSLIIPHPIQIDEDSEVVHFYGFLEFLVKIS